MISRTGMMGNPHRAANAWSSGSLAMVPSSFMISQSTPAGYRPARAARSTAASVWPARRRTPPGVARRGNTWPGRERSSGRVAGSTRALMVAARSWAEMPVVILCFAPHGHRESRPLVGRVVADHEGQVEFLDALGGQGHGDQAAGVLQHEVDGLRGHVLSGHDQVALVLSVLIVDDDDEPAAPDGLHGLLHRGKDRSGFCALTHRPSPRVRRSAPPPLLRHAHRGWPPARRTWPRRRPPRSPRPLPPGSPGWWTRTCGE